MKGLTSLLLVALAVLSLTLVLGLKMKLEAKIGTLRTLKNKLFNSIFAFIDQKWSKNLTASTLLKQKLY
ncbi:MAG: hypothetical protein COB62_07785 [Piscirickettsiaceae bacterium]|nr:MAG: hypothetical protein COB62_07785 [Piscirickettsiaceae bacterium]